MHGTLKRELLTPTPPPPIRPISRLPRAVTNDDLLLLEELAQAEARESFWAYRRYIHPKLIDGWWQREVAAHLQQLYDDFAAGLKPKLLLMSPPQHGKSSQVVDLVSWISGHNPDLRTIYASFSDDLGIRANRELQRLYDSTLYQKAFPDTRINAENIVTVSGRPLRNSTFIEFVGHTGSFRNTTVLGQITGQGLDIGIVDDPIKGREAAMSEAIRNKTWDWFTDDFFSRFSENAALVMILTRWHVDDPAGRFIEKFPGLKVLKYPAIAEKNEKYRRRGEALFPELKSIDFIEERRKLMTVGGFESLYQQHPTIKGGGDFPVDKIRLVKEVVKRDVVKSVRYVDKAATEGGGAWTAMVLMHYMADGTYAVSDVRRGQWGSLEREQRLKQICVMDTAQWGNVGFWVEQEPGGSGKESAESTIRNLAGYSIRADRVTGSKEVRAEPYSAQVQGGNVAVQIADWNSRYLEELENFPTGKYKDQVDASSGAFNKLAADNLAYDESLSWV